MSKSCRELTWVVGQNFMKPSDLFGVIVRTFGLCVLVWSLWYFVSGLGPAIGFGAEERAGDNMYFLMTGAVGIGIAMVLLRCAQSIVRFSYPAGEGKRDEPS